MASTNKTTNYDLSQFVGTDKPAWLSDYNGDMAKIDAGVHTAQTTATGADGKADTANTKIGNLANLTTGNKNNCVEAINEVDGHADTAQETANTALTNANTANTNITGLSNYLNLNSFTNVTTVSSTNGSASFVNMNYASNNTASLGKIYGEVDFNSVSAGNTVITLGTVSNFRPTSLIKILACGICTPFDGSMNYPVDIEIATNGTVTLNCYMEANKLHRLIIHPCLLFIKDFGDAS